MPLWSRLWPFLGYSVEAAPLDRGVYGLWQDGQLIYIGCTGGPEHSIRSRLMEHLNKREAGGSVPDHYSWEVADDPEGRKAEVLERFKAMYWKLPKLNRQW